MKNDTQEYDGTAWSAGGNLPTALYVVKGAGTSSAGLSIGGYSGGQRDLVYEYDGGAGSYAEMFTPSQGL